MPKIRKKAKLKKIDGSYPQKSGVLSKSIKKIIQDEDSLQGQIPAEKFFDSHKKDFKKTKILAFLDTTDSAMSYRDHVIFDFNKYNQLDNLVFFNDTEINNLGNQLINPVLGVSSSLIEKTTIFSNSNMFTTSSNFETRVNNISNSNFSILKNDRNFQEVYNTYDETLRLENKQEIVIDLPMKTDLYLSNLYDTNSANTYISLRQAQLFSRGLDQTEVYRYHDQRYGAYRKNLAYYNFNKMGWDYNNTPRTLDKSRINNPHTPFYPGGHSPHFIPPVTPSILQSSSSIGLPVQNFGFPWRQSYTGGSENLLYMGNYINKNFVLEDVVFEAIITSRCETRDPAQNSYTEGQKYETSSNIDLANSIDFFILNQKINNVNTDRFLNNATTNVVTASFQIGTNNTYTTFNVDLNGNNLVNSWTEAELSRIQNYSEFHNKNTFTDLKYVDTEYDNQFNSMFPRTKNDKSLPLFNLRSSGGRGLIFPSHREIVTYNTFLTYNNYTQDQSNIDWETASNGVNYVHKFETENSLAAAHINFTSASFVISGSCVKTNKYKNAGAFSIFTNSTFASYRYSTDINRLDERSILFLSNEYAERDALGNLSGRDSTGFSSSSTILSSSNISYGTDSITYNNITNSRKYSPYVLSPEDTLMFGVHSFSNLDEFPALFKLHDNLRVRLIGRYENIEDDNIISSNKRGMTSNSVRSTIIGNTHVVNQYDTEPIYFMSGSYLDNVFTGSLDSTSGRTIRGSLSSGLEGTFTRTVTLTNTENIIYDSMMPNFLDIMKINNRNVHYHGSNNMIYLVNQKEYSGYNGVEDIEHPWTTEAFLNWGAFEEWNYDFPFEDNYLHLRRLQPNTFNIDSSVRDIQWDTTLPTDLIDVLNHPENSLTDIEPYKPGFPILLERSAKSGYRLYRNSTVGGDFIQFRTDTIENNYYTRQNGKLWEWNLILFSSFLTIDFIKFGYGSGFTPRTTMPIPVSCFKYGVYNPNPVKVTKHFNWRSYGQFSDMYNSSTNTAFFKKDQGVNYPVIKNFVDSKLNDIEAINAAYTYNKDSYSRSGKPFFD